MRDFRDAKAMAQTLRESLLKKDVSISHSESLELVSKMLGTADWNTLSALIQTDRQESWKQVDHGFDKRKSYPALPIKDFVPFPATQFPVFVGRVKTKHSLDSAFARQREVVLVVQRDPALEEPEFDDIYEIGVLAHILELEHFPGDARISGRPIVSGTLKVLLHAHRRVHIRRFIGEGNVFEAHIVDISEGPIPDAPQLIRNTVAQFKIYAARHEIAPKITPGLERIRDPGRLADVIASHVVLPLHEKQRLLATVDAVARLEHIAALIDENV